MKLVIASDIHGSAHWCRKLMDAIDAEAPDSIVLLGDLLYHGPRNGLPFAYAPKEVIPMLNSLAGKVIAVRGNCDAEVDQMVLDFPLESDYAVIMDGERQLFCTHGHVFSPHDHPALSEGSAFLSGHTHVKTNVVRDGIRYVNPGSVSIPKDGSNSYAVYEDGEFTLKELV